MKHILTPREYEHFPNLHKFWTATGFCCNGRTRIHHVEFFQDGPRYRSNVQLGDPDTSTTQAFIIEQPDTATLRYFWDSYIIQKRSFLQCLDDFFHDQPSFNFTQIRPKILQMPSVLTKQTHLTFSYVLAREFDKSMRLDYSMIQKAAKDFGTWRDDRDFGPMNPVQRRELSGETTTFAPLALTRTSATAWFDSSEDRPWRLGTSAAFQQDCHMLIEQASFYWTGIRSSGGCHANCRFHLPSSMADTMGPLTPALRRTFY